MYIFIEKKHIILYTVLVQARLLKFKVKKKNILMVSSKMKNIRVNSEEAKHKNIFEKKKRRL